LGILLNWTPPFLLVSGILLLNTKSSNSEIGSLSLIVVLLSLCTLVIFIDSLILFKISSIPSRSNLLSKIGNNSFKVVIFSEIEFTLLDRISFSNSIKYLLKLPSGSFSYFKLLYLDIQLCKSNILLLVIESEIITFFLTFYNFFY
jgi:hypothetical protein